MSEELCLNRSHEEIEDRQGAVEDTQLSGRESQYPDLTYEDGIQETIGWLFGDGDHPYMGGKWYQDADPRSETQGTITGVSEKVKE